MPKIKPLVQRLAGLVAAGATIIIAFGMTAAPAYSQRDVRFGGPVGQVNINAFRRGGDWRFHNRRGFQNRAFIGRNWAWADQRRFRRFQNRRFVDRRGGLDATGAAIVGAGIGVLGLAILNQNRVNQRPAPVIVQQPVVVQPPLNVIPQQSFGQPFAANQGVGQCLQVREYQTTIIVGGVQREAYGNACLQPDGSWRQGPAVLLP